MRAWRIMWPAALLLAEAALAQEQPIVRISIEPEQVTVGQAAKMRVTVLVPTWFTRPPEFPSFEIANAIVRLPPDSSRPTSERIEGESWAGISRNYQFYPLLGASYRLSGLDMQVEYANPGKKPLHADIALDDIELRAVVPDGAENLNPYLAGRSLKFTLSTQGDMSALGAGDALVLVYTAELDGLPAMFLPPLAPDLQLPGVAVYAQTPVFEDTVPARRTEKITLVFEAGGEFSVPGASLDWWNTHTFQVETASIERLSFHVTGPALASQSSVPAVERDWRAIALWIASSVVAVLLLWRYLPIVLTAVRERIEAYRRSEACAFRELRETLRESELVTVYHAFAHWLERLAPGTDARRFASDYGTDGLCVEIDRLLAAAYSDAGHDVDLAQLSTELHAARARFHASRAQLRSAELPLLNP